MMGFQFKIDSFWYEFTGVNVNFHIFSEKHLVIKNPENRSWRQTKPRIFTFQQTFFDGGEFF